MKLKLRNFEGTNLINSDSVFSDIEVSDKVFGCAFNSSLIHQVVSSYLTNARQGTKAQKSRSEVSGSNRKPWRQKGTGRARSGTLKSPLWRSGGVTFAAKQIQYNQKINKKMYRGAIRSILSRLVYENRLFLIEDLYLDQPKTKFLLKKLEWVMYNVNNVLIFTNVLDKNLILASRNIYKLKIRNALDIDPISLINFSITLITKSAISNIENRLI